MAFVLNDYGSLVASGRRGRALDRQQAGDGWFTTTFTGTATIAPFLDPGLTPPDPNVRPSPAT